MTNRSSSHRNGMSACAAALLLVAAAPLAAQSPAPAIAAAARSRAQASAQTATPSGPVLQLSMDQAVAMAVQTNLGLKAQRLNLDIASQAIAGAQAAFKPLLTSSFSTRTSDSVPSSFTDASGAVISSSNLSGNIALSQLLPWYGGGYQVSWQNSRATTTGFATFNPNLSSQFQFVYTQPLLRGFLTDQNRVGLETAERQREVADIDLEVQLIGTQTAVRFAYLSLISAKAQRQVAEQNMDLAKGQLAKEQAMVAVGQAAPIDVIQLETTVASQEDQIIFADQQVADAQDQLRSLVLDPNRVDYWSVQFDPTDTLTVVERNIDLDAAIKSAMADRLDLKEAQRNLGISDLNLQLDQNLRRPALNAQALYSATGTGGTQFTFGSGFPPPILSETVRSFGSLLGDTFLGTYPTWSVGLSLSYPIGRTAQDATLARDRLRRDQQAIAIQQLQLQVAADVRQASRAVLASYRRVQATKDATAASQRQFDAEQKKFEAGLTDSFTTAQKQQALANAKVAELSAVILYNQALLNYDRVQKIH